MTKAIEIIKMPRLRILEAVDGLTIDQLNKIPAEFNNNIIWNLGHMVAAQQGVCYKRAGVTAIIDDEFWNTFRPETKPERFFDESDFENIKRLFISTIDQLEIDLANNLFPNYTPWTNRYGAELSNIQEAVSFLPFHEGFHTGYIFALKRVI
ncbi:MAG: DinB family protein [Mucilaginibacter sp.]|uniref:DinB family protein n=1 Tax=Mucilaginibacter sp. TaxID=1882438 RepID=UPI0026338551|nr:DinB family protein [Mucilaginibacter sp.]MDB5003361.1 DinB family protein [Mucilaginibacter sp.]